MKLKELKKLSPIALTGYNKAVEIIISGETYYFALYDDDIKEGDYVFVNGKASGSALRVNKVLSLKDLEKRYHKPLVAEVVCKLNFDLSAYEKRDTLRRKLSEMQKEIDLKLDLLNREKLRELYAEQDEEFAEMLDEYDFIKAKLNNISKDKPKLVDIYIKELNKPFSWGSKLIGESISVELVSERIRKYIKENHSDFCVPYKIEVNEDRNEAVCDFRAPGYLIMVKAKNFKLDEATAMKMF